MLAKDYYNNLEKENILCPITKSDRWLPLLKGDRHGMDIETMICLDSGFIATNPRPKPFELLKFYKENYREYYFTFPNPSAPEYQKSTNRDVSLNRAGWLLSFCIEQLVAKATSGPVRVLDIGCADGCFLAAAAVGLRAANVPSILFGVEPDPQYADYAAEASGATVLQGGFEDNLATLAHSSQQFDLIVLSHVLEHLCEPDEIVRKISTLLSEDGLLLIEVPNILSPCWSGFGMFHLAHINHFIPETLCALLEGNGFGVEKLFHGIHPVDPWAMTILARKGLMIQPAYCINNVVQPARYGPSAIEFITSLIRSKTNYAQEKNKQRSFVSRLFLKLKVIALNLKNAM